MTLPDERTRAVLRARAFLSRLCSPYGNGIKGIRSDVRQEARRILRHFPHWFDLGRADAFDAAAAQGIAETEAEVAGWAATVNRQLRKAAE